MRGTIEKVFHNETDAGKKWIRLQIDDESYSLWEKKLFDVAKEGAVVEFSFCKRGNFNTITNMEVVATKAESSVSPVNGTADKQIQISRLSLLKTAVEFLPEGTTLNRVIGAAMRMEEYVLGQIDPGELEEETVSPGTPPPLNLPAERKRIRGMILEMYDGDPELATSYLFRVVKQRKFDAVTLTEFAELKPRVEEDYATWVAEQGGPDSEGLPFGDQE